MANSPNEKSRSISSGNIDNLNAVLVLLTFMWTVPESNQPHGLLVHLTVVSATKHNCPFACTTSDTGLSHQNTTKYHYSPERWYHLKVYFYYFHFPILKRGDYLHRQYTPNTQTQNKNTTKQKIFK